MRNTFAAIFALVLLTQPAHAQQQQGAGRAAGPAAAPAQPPAAAESDRGWVKAKAEELSKAFTTGDYERFAALTHPAVVAMTGGKEAMVAMVKKDMEGMRADGFVVESFTAGEPARIVRGGLQLYAVVPTKMRMKTPQGVYVSRSFFLGVSEDGGKSWTFVGGTGATSKAELKTLLPYLPDDLELPAPQPVELEKP